MGTDGGDGFEQKATKGTKAMKDGDLARGAESAIFGQSGLTRPSQPADAQLTFGRWMSPEWPMMP